MSIFGMFSGMKSSLCVALALLVASTHSLAAGNPFDVSSDLDQSLRSGLHALYNLDFDGATAVFDSIEKQAPDHPMVAFGKASIYWWYLSVYVLESDEKESEPFLKAVEECIRYSREKIDRGDPTGEAYMTLGGAYGLLGRWQATNQKWVSAYFTGKKAIRYLRKSLKINPNMNDAYMGLGIFDYYVATLPSVVRVLAFLGTGGDSQVGLNELETAATKGTYAQTPAKLFLTDLYSNQENKPEKAFEILANLRQEYPTSPFVHMMRVITLYNHNRMEEMRKEVQSYLDRVEKGVYRKEFSTNGHFAAGMVHFKVRNWTEAIKEFDLAIQNGTIKNPFLSWSELYKGFALDAMGRRVDAVKQYEEVLREIRRWGSHESAKRHLSKPFEGTDAQLEKIRL